MGEQSNYKSKPINTKYSKGASKLTTYYRPSRDKHGSLFALILTPDAAKPTQSSANFGNSLSAGNGIAAMKAYMQEYYGDDVEMASPAKWQREIESRAFHSPEIIAMLERQSELFGVDATSYIVYGSTMRPVSTIWFRVEDAMCIPADRQQTGYHTYIAVPNALDKEVIEKYELEFVSRLAIEE